MHYGDKARYNSKKCRSCGVVTSVFGEIVKAPAPAFVALQTEDGRTLELRDYRAVGPCRSCGRRVFLIPVLGKVIKEKVCDGRCMGATGHTCECSCGGANHGMNHA